MKSEDHVYQPQAVESKQKKEISLKFTQKLKQSIPIENYNEVPKLGFTLQDLFSCRQSVNTNRYVHGRGGRKTGRG